MVKSYFGPLPIVLRGHRRQVIHPLPYSQQMVNKSRMIRTHPRISINFVLSATLSRIPDWVSCYWEVPRAHGVPGDGTKRYLCLHPHHLAGDESTEDDVSSTTVQPDRTSLLETFQTHLDSLYLSPPWRTHSNFLKLN